jgi:hypothetical protein
MKIDFFIEKKSPPHRTQKRFLDISRAINGNIEFGNPKDGPININGSWQKLTTPNVADTEFTLTHNLGRIPEGFITVSVDKAAIVYASRKSQWTTTQAFFKVNQASVALEGFII